MLVQTTAEQTIYDVNMALHLRNMRKWRVFVVASARCAVAGRISISIMITALDEYALSYVLDAMWH